MWSVFAHWEIAIQFVKAQRYRKAAGEADGRLPPLAWSKQTQLSPCMSSSLLLHNMLLSWS